MKARPHTTEPKKPTQPALPSEFFNWWKEHPHSGFYQTPEGTYRWNILPREAWNCDRYRAEFSKP